MKRPSKWQTKSIGGPSRIRPPEGRNGEEIADRFEILACAGVGGMGVVYRAHDKQSGQDVALKLIDSMRVDPARFEREAETLARLSHPAIVRYIDHGNTPRGESFLAMEWLDGFDLRKLLSERMRLSVAQSITLIRRIAAALAEAHLNGVIHRDIKPSNIYLVNGELEQVKLIDFGVARQLTSVRLTQSGVRVGTPGYFSPEQARGWRWIDSRADIFSLGCVFYESLTGQRAFDGENETAVLTKLLFELPPPVHEIVPSIPGEIVNLVERMMSKDAPDRPQNGQAVLDILHRISQHKLTPANLLQISPLALTENERTVVSVIVAANASTPPPAQKAKPLDGSATVNEVPVNPLMEIVEPFQGRVELLFDGSAAVMLTGEDTADELAFRSARCALELHAAMGQPPMALATGHGEVDGELPVGQVIDRATAMLGRATGDAILIDDNTARLIDRRFVINVARDGETRSLFAERVVEQHAPTLLGKPSPFVGRKLQLKTIGDAWRACVTIGGPSVLQVVGAAGVGKTRLRYEFTRQLADNNLLMLVGRGDPMRAESALGVLGPAIRRCANILQGEPAAEQRAKLSERILRHFPAGDHGWVVQFIGEMCGIGFDGSEGDDDRLHDARSDSLLMGDMTRAALETWLVNETSVHPVLVILDDLQWADHPTVYYIDHLLNSLKRRPLFVLTLARPEISSRFTSLFAGIPSQTVHLPPLDSEACSELVTGILGVRTDPEAVSRLVRLSEGNAYFLEELLREAHEDQEQMLPNSIVQMIDARLTRLNPMLRRVLRAASVFGQTFWFGGVVKLLGGEQKNGELEPLLSTLLARELISPSTETTFPAEQQYQFRSEAIRLGAYAMLTDEDRELGHRLAGRWLWKMGETDSLVLAGHFERGHEATRAVTFYHRAAMDALEANDFTNAIKRAAQAIDCGAGGEIRGQLRLLQTISHRWQGDAYNAEKYANEAVSLIPSGSAEWLTAVGELLCASGAMVRKEPLTQWTAELRRFRPSEASAQRPWIIALCHAATEHIYAGNLSVSGEIIDELQKLVGDRGWRNLRVYALLLRVIALRALHSGNPGRAMALMQASARFFQRVGDQRLALSHQVTLGFIHFELGDYQIAADLFVRAIELSSQLGLVEVVAMARQHLGITLTHLGRTDAGIATEDQALNMLQDQNNLRLKITARNTMSQIMLIADRPQRAEAEARAAFKLSAHQLPLRIKALTALSNALLYQDRPTQALDAAEKAMTKLIKSGHAKERESQLRLVYSEALYRSGDAETAYSALRTARNLLLEAAEKITDPALRKSFMEKVPEHARIVQLAKDWGIPSY